MPAGPRRSPWLLGAAGLTVVYAVCVLGYAATAPDIRLRSLLGSKKEEVNGLPVQVVDGIIWRGEQPTSGVELVELADQKITSFLDFVRVQREELRSRIPSAGEINAGADPSRSVDLPGLVKEYETDRRWVRVRFREPDSEAVRTGWLAVQSLPISDVGLSLVWFILQLGILAVAGVAYWFRSYDRTTGLFFAMCIVTLGGYIGGFHWWVIAANPVLVWGFIVTGVLIPVVTLHFFLCYPRPPRFMVRRPTLSLLLLYSVPVLTACVLLGLSVRSWWTYNYGGADADAIRGTLESIANVTLGYLLLSAGYLIATLAAMAYSFLKKTPDPIEHQQMRWMLIAAVVSFGLVVLAFLPAAEGEGSDFAQGGTSLPMMVASLCFMLAYAVGMVRYRLMMLDQVASRGVLYYIVSLTVTALFATLLAFGSLWSEAQRVDKAPSNFFVWVMLLILSVALLVWGRDRLQRWIDRRFFEGKSRLGQALRQLNSDATRFSTPDSVGDLLLKTCRDVLRVDRAAFYLKRAGEGKKAEDAPFQLVSSIGGEQLPLQIPATPELLAFLNRQGFAQRTVSTTREQMSPAQVLLRELDATLVQTIESASGADTPRVAGLLVFGGRSGNASFTAEDLTFLNAMCQVGNLALHSARVQQQVTRLTDELQHKSDRLIEQQQQLELAKARLEESAPERGAGANSDGRAEDITDAASGVLPAFRRGAIRGHSPKMLRVLETVRKVTGSESTVLVRGESGTGKELLAQVLHENSRRREGPMIKVHCGALAPSLLESELFGHVKGAFTGAVEDKVGRFQAADGGTLFLDEIGDISMETQIKLLRVLQERTFEPVGSGEPVTVDVRLITATHRNLEQLIAEGTFREDLFYRLNVITITLPPLRERPEDLIELAMHFLGEAATKTNRPEIPISAEALACLERYHWPGNIRELQNVIERAVVLAEGEKITIGDLPTELVRAARFNPIFHQKASTRTAVPADQVPLPRLTPDSEEDEKSERVRLLEALEEAAGNKAEAARRLGMPRSTYFSKLKKYGLS